MDIKGKIKVEKQIIYYVCCPKCGHNFKQTGRRFNLWRDLKKRHKLKHKEIRTIQKEFMRKLVQDGEYKFDEKDNVLEIGDVIFVKPEDGDLGFLKPRSSGER